MVEQAQPKLLQGVGSYSVLALRENKFVSCGGQHHPHITLLLIHRLRLCTPLLAGTGVLFCPHAGHNDDSAAGDHDTAFPHLENSRRI